MNFFSMKSPLPLTAARVLTLALVLVAMLFGLAMACFPPGHCGVASGYSFSKHVVSDLGRTRLSNGAPNTLSCALFAAAMTVAGLSSALFWLARHTYLSHPTARRISFTCGLAMSVLMAAIGFTPLNLASGIHDPLTAATALATAIAVLTLFVDPHDRLEPRPIKRGWLILLLAVLSAWTVMVILHRLHLMAFRPWMPIGQKMVIASFVSWLGYQTVLLFNAQTDSFADGA